MYQAPDERSSIAAPAVVYFSNLLFEAEGLSVAEISGGLAVLVALNFRPRTAEEPRAFRDCTGGP